MITAEEAMNALRYHMKADPDYAWAWHCNLAMMAFDAGATHADANERASDFMHGTFGVRPKCPDPQPQDDSKQERS